jgi:AmmeMemoRadiSam system protein A
MSDRPLGDAAWPAEAGSILTGLARAAIGERLGMEARRPAEPRPPWLLADGACFVTLTIRGRLRGCIGSLQAYRALGDDVRGNAQAAAFHDHRFPILRSGDFDLTDIEVSVLSTPEPLPFTSEADALDQLRPGVDGVVFAAKGRRATYLPGVWEQLPDKVEFLGELKRKAGVDAAYWGADVELWRYGVTAFHERRG